MRNKMKYVTKWIMVLLITGLLIIPQTVSAGTNTATVHITSFEKISDVQAEANVYATCVSPTTMIATIELQRSPEGADNFTTKAGPYTKTVYNSTSISRTLYFAIEEGYDYRIKVDITDYVNGYATTITAYTDLAESTGS